MVRFLNALSCLIGSVSDCYPASFTKWGHFWGEYPTRAWASSMATSAEFRQNARSGELPSHFSVQSVVGQADADAYFSGEDWRQSPCALLPHPSLRRVLRFPR